MNRAVLLIGVSRTAGDLGDLQAVEASIDSMEQWALKQGIPRHLILRRTDAKGPVTPSDLFDAVSSLVELDTIDQLIIYFAGHGVVNNRSEYWLLSGAPTNATAAVNVANNITLAQAGAFSHVVLISDACRTPTTNVQYGRIIGSDIFPNIVDAELERSVDIFFGTSLGAPALELQQREQSKQYQAVYSAAILDALGGRIPGTVVNGKVRPRPLKRALPMLVREKIRDAGFSVATNQTPDARITSDDEAWLALVDLPISSGAMPPAAPPSPPPPPAPQNSEPVPRGGRGPRPPSPGVVGARPSPSAPAAMSTRDVAELMFQQALRTPIYGRDFPTPAEARSISGRSITTGAGRFFDKAPLPIDLSTPQALNTRQGFEVEGALLTSVICPDGEHQIVQEGALYNVSVNTASRQSQALLEFDDGTSVLLPVIPGYIGALRLRDNRLDEVWYEPSNSNDALSSRTEIDFLRQVIIRSCKLGVFTLQGDDPDKLMQRMQSMKFVDPALAVYAAYAYSEAGKFRQIGQMQQYLLAQLNVQIYDLALLSRSLLREPELVEHLSPRLPLLAQGWAMTNALLGGVPADLEPLRGELLPSLWSLYTPDGTALLRTWLSKQDRTVTTGATL